MAPGAAWIVDDILADADARAVTPRAVRFAGNVEPPRAEHFLAEPARPRSNSDRRRRRPHIVSSVRQCLGARSGYPARATADPLRRDRRDRGERWRLDARDLGDAGSSPAILPPPGAHRRALVGSDGRAGDQILFTVK
jgi:penicillin-binding protein 1C